jgi:hypothetical protein
MEDDLLYYYILVNKRNDTKIFFKYIFMLKQKQWFNIIYVNVCMKRAYHHKTNSGKYIFRPMIDFA